MFVNQPKKNSIWVKWKPKFLKVDFQLISERQGRKHQAIFLKALQIPEPKCTEPNPAVTLESRPEDMWIFVRKTDIYATKRDGNFFQDCLLTFGLVSSRRIMILDPTNLVITFKWLPSDRRNTWITVYPELSACVCVFQTHKLFP